MLNSSIKLPCRRAVQISGFVLLVFGMAPQSSAIYSTGFEPGQGYVIGDLNGQDGWMVDAGSGQVTAGIARSGLQSARVVAGGSISRLFFIGSESVVWCDTYMRAVPASGPSIPSVPRSAALFVDNAGILLLNGNGSGGGTWINSGINPAAGSWFRVTIRLDFTVKKWDCYIDGVLAGLNLGFHSNSINTLSGMTVKAQPTGDTYIDDLALTGNANPPLGDADQDGILDIVEGNPPAAGQTNMYLADSDGDGLADGVEDANRNGVRNAGETDPRNRDSDGDGIIDGIEVKLYNSNPLNIADPGPRADQDSDELPDDYDFAGLTLPDTDGDRIKDGFEAVTLGLDATMNAGVFPSLGDINGDGYITNVDGLVVQSMFLSIIPFNQMPNTTWSDLNRDALITNVDALIAQSMFLSLIANIPI